MFTRWKEATKEPRALGAQGVESGSGSAAPDSGQGAPWKQDFPARPPGASCLSLPGGNRACCVPGTVGIVSLHLLVPREQIPSLPFLVVFVEDPEIQRLSR